MSIENQEKSTKSGYWLVFFGVVLFATIEVAVKDLHHHLGSIAFPPVLFTTLRFTVAGLLFVVLNTLNKNAKAKAPVGVDILKTIILGILAAPVAIGLFQWALTFKALKASSGAAIFSINPIFAAMIAAIFLKEKASVREWIGLILGFAGAFVMSFPFAEGIKGELLVAGIVMISSAFFFALNVVLAKPLINKYGGMCYTGWSFLIGGIVAGII